MTHPRGPASAHDDIECPHLFEAASLSAHLVEAETERDRLLAALTVAREALAEAKESVCSEYCNETTRRHVGTCKRGDEALAAIDRATTGTR